MIKRTLAVLFTILAVVTWSYYAIRVANIDSYVPMEGIVVERTYNAPTRSVNTYDPEYYSLKIKYAFKGEDHFTRYGVSVDRIGDFEKGTSIPIFVNLNNPNDFLLFEKKVPLVIPIVWSLITLFVVLNCGKNSVLPKSTGQI